MRQYQTIKADETIKTAVAMLLNGQSRNFLVTENAVSVGTLSREEIIKALSEQGENVVIQDVMNKNLIYLDANAPLEDAYQQVQQSTSSLMPVMENKQLVGTLDAENILEFIMVKNATGNKQSNK
jgi:predicted transcriptional regulator